MKLSDFHPDDIQLVKSSAPMRLSDFHPSEISLATPDADAPNQSPITAATTGLMQGATLGFGDEIGAVGKTAMDAITGNAGPLAGMPLSDLMDDYRQTRDSLRSDNAAAKKANPKTALAASLVGSVASGNIAGAGDTAAARIGQAAAFGGANALGDSNADLTQGDVTGALNDTGKGMAIGGLTGGLVEGVMGTGATLSDADALRDFAEQRAVRSLNPTKTELKTLQLQRGLQEGETGVNKLGRSLLDNKIVTPLASLDDKLAGAQALAQDSGERIGNTLETLDAQGVPSFSPSELADEIEQKLASPLADFKTAQPTYNTLQNVASDVRNFEGDTFGTAQEIKDFVAGQVEASGGFKSLNPSEKNQALKDVYSMVKKKMEERAEQAADGSLAEGYQQAKLDYGNSQSAQDILQNAVARRDANKTFGITDAIAGLGGVSMGVASHGAMLGGPIGAAAVLGGKKLVEKYGNNVAAVGADKIADIVASNPSVFGPFQSVMQSAAARGAASIAATHYMLQQTNPEYRERMKQVFNQ